jgi:hypothetical protein
MSQTPLCCSSFSPPLFVIHFFILHFFFILPCFIIHFFVIHFFVCVVAAGAVGEACSSIRASRKEIRSRFTTSCGIAYALHMHEISVLTHLHTFKAWVCVDARHVYGDREGIRMDGGSEGVRMHACMHSRQAVCRH